MGTTVSRFGVSTYSYMYAYDAEACLSHLAARGYRRFELMMFPGHCWPSEMDRSRRTGLRNFLGEASLELTSLNQPNIDINLAGATPEMRAYSAGTVVKAIELAADIECPAVVITPGKPNALMPLPVGRLMDWFYQALDAFLPVAQRNGVQILVENMPISFLPRAEDLASALDGYGDASVGIVYDIANAVFLGEDLEQGLARLKSRLRLIHLSDTPRGSCEHRAFGTSDGIVSVDTLLREIHRLGNSATVLFEFISADPDRDLARSEAILSAAKADHG